MLLPAINGTQNMLAAAKSEPSVEHFVFTSSALAVMDLTKMPRPGYTYTRNDWNPASMFDHSDLQSFCP